MFPRDPFECRDRSRLSRRRMHFGRRARDIAYTLDSPREIFADQLRSADRTWTRAMPLIALLQPRERDFQIVVQRLPTVDVEVKFQIN